MDLEIRVKDDYDQKERGFTVCRSRRRIICIVNDDLLADPVNGVVDDAGGAF